MVTASIGPSVTPAALGPLMENVTDLWFLYLLMIEATLELLLFLVLFAVAKFVIKKNIHMEIEIDNPNQDAQVDLDL